MIKSDVEATFIVSPAIPTTWMPLLWLLPAQFEPCKTEPIPCLCTVAEPFTLLLVIVATLALSTLPAPPPAIQSAPTIGIVACISSKVPTETSAVALIVPNAVDEYVKYNVKSWVPTICLSIIHTLFNIQEAPTSVNKFVISVGANKTSPAL